MSAATTLASSEPLPNYEVLDECFTEVDLDLDHECGYVTVPEYHDGRSNRAMRLAVVRIFATGEGEAGLRSFLLMAALGHR